MFCCTFFAYNVTIHCFFGPALSLAYDQSFSYLGVNNLSKMNWIVFFYFLFSIQRSCIGVNIVFYVRTGIDHV